MFLVTILQKKKKFKGTGDIHFSKIVHLAPSAQYRTDRVLICKELAEEASRVGLIIATQRS